VGLSKTIRNYSPAPLTWTKCKRVGFRKMLVLSRRNLLSLKIYEGNHAKDIKNADTIKIPP